MLAGSGIDQGSLSLNSQSVLRKSLKVARLNPVKGKEDWQTWLPQACAPLSDVTREAVKQAVIALNPPTYDGVQNMLGPNATEDETLAWYETYATAYEEAQNEAYILVESYVDWSSSSIGKVMFKQIIRRFGEERSGLDALNYLAKEFDTSRSFADQQRLRNAIAPDKVKSSLAAVDSPSSASHALYEIYENWLLINGNSVDWPFPFVQLIVNAMGEIDDHKISNLAFSHCTSLDRVLAEADMSLYDADKNFDMNHSVAKSLPEMYTSGDAFIKALARSWPTRTHSQAKILVTKTLAEVGGNYEDGSDTPKHLKTILAAIAKGKTSPKEGERGKKRNCMFCPCYGCFADSAREKCIVINAKLPIPSSLTAGQALAVTKARDYVKGHGADALLKAKREEWYPISAEEKQKLEAERAKLRASGKIKCTRADGSTVETHESDVIEESIKSTPMSHEDLIQLLEATGVEINEDDPSEYEGSLGSLNVLKSGAEPPPGFTFGTAKKSGANEPKDEETAIDDRIASTSDAIANAAAAGDVEALDQIVVGLEDAGGDADGGPKGESGEVVDLEDVGGVEPRSPPRAIRSDTSSHSVSPVKTAKSAATPSLLATRTPKSSMKSPSFAEYYRAQRLVAAGQTPQPPSAQRSVVEQRARRELVDARTKEAYRRLRAWGRDAYVRARENGPTKQGILTTAKESATYVIDTISTATIGDISRAFNVASILYVMHHAATRTKLGKYVIGLLASSVKSLVATGRDALARRLNAIVSRIKDVIRGVLVDAIASSGPFDQSARINMAKPLGSQIKSSHLYVLSDGGATHSVTNDKKWLWPKTVQKSPVGYMTGCEAGGGIFASHEGVVGMVVPALDEAAGKYKATLLCRKWQYADKVSENVFSDSFEKKEHGSIFDETRNADGSLARHIVLEDGTRVKSQVDAKTYLSYIKLIVDPSIVAAFSTERDGAARISEMIDRLNGDYVEPIDEIIGGALLGSNSMIERIIAQGSVMLARHTSMTAVTLSHAELLSVAHATYSHAPVPTLVKSVYGACIRPYNDIGKLKVAEAKAFMLAGCDICDSVRMRRPPVPQRPSGQPPPKAVEGERYGPNSHRFKNKEITQLEFDIFGPIECRSIEGYHYVHGFSVKRLMRNGKEIHKAGVLLYGQPDKSESSVRVAHQSMLVDLSLRADAIDVIRYDNAKETKAHGHANLLIESYIRGEWTGGYMHAHIGSIERWWQPLFVGALCNLRQLAKVRNADVDRRYWYVAMMHANRSLDSLATLDADGNYTSPHMRRCGVEADADLFAPFGCNVRYLVDKSLRSKFDDHSKQGTYLGVSPKAALCVIIEGPSGARAEVHGGMVVPDLVPFLLPASPALRDYAKNVAERAASLGVSGDDDADDVEDDNGGETADDPASGAAPRRTTRHSGPGDAAPLAAAAPRPARGPAVPRFRAGEEKMLLRKAFPQYPCNELGGLGWRVELVAYDGGYWRIKYVEATDDDGEPYADDFVVRSLLEPVPPAFVSSPTDGSQYSAPPPAGASIHLAKVGFSASTHDIGKLVAGEPLPPALAAKERTTTGGLIHVINVRPDLAYATNRVARFSAKPTAASAKANDHIVKYAMATKSEGLVFGGPDAVDFEHVPDFKPFTRDSEGKFIKVYGPYAYADADLQVPIDMDIESSPGGSRSTYGFAVMLGGACVASCAKRQQAVAVDIFSSELFALSMAMMTARTLHQQLIALGFGDIADHPITCFCDNDSVVKVARRRSALQRGAWTGRRARNVQEMQDEGCVVAVKVDTDDNPSNSLTKATTVEMARRDFSFIMGHPIEEWEVQTKKANKHVSWSDESGNKVLSVAKGPPSSSPPYGCEHKWISYGICPATGVDGTACGGRFVACERPHCYVLKCLDCGHSELMHDFASKLDAEAAEDDAEFEAALPPYATDGVLFATKHYDTDDPTAAPSDTPLEDAPPLAEHEEIVDADMAEKALAVLEKLEARMLEDEGHGHQLLGCFFNKAGGAVFAAQHKDGKTIRLLTDHGFVDVEEPESYKDVLRSEDRAKWMESMAVEYETFNSANTYRLVPLSSIKKGTRIFKLVWKYKIKRNADLTLDKYKSRCCLQGNWMKQGIDYLESFSVGARAMSVKIIFAIAAVYDWEDFLLDIKGAFLLTQKPSEGVGSETVVYQPPGFEQTGPNGEAMVGILNTFVYGDPAAGRAWMELFDSVLVNKLGAVADDIDANLFRVKSPHGRVVFAKHVDELIGAAENVAARTWVNDTISAHLDVGAFTRWSTVLGYGVTRDRATRTVKIDAERLIVDINKRRNE